MVDIVSQLQWQTKAAFAEEYIIQSTGYFHLSFDRNCHVDWL